MEAVKYTIDDYAHFNDFGSGIIIEGEDFFKFNRIDETKGIIDDYVQIIDELYDVISNTAQVPFNSEKFYTSYYISGYKMKQNCFIDSLSLTVLTKSKVNSYFYGQDAKINKELNKLSNFIIVIGIQDIDLKSSKGKEEFYSEMAHELQHIYRFYCILLSDNSNYEDEEKKKMWRNRNATKVMNSEGEDTIQNKINTLYYLSEKNEISSETNRLYEYLRSHKEIDSFSYHDVENELPLYNLIINLKNGIKIIDSNLKDIDFVNECGNICKVVMGDIQSTPSRSLLKFRTRLIYGVMFAERNYKRTLAKAFKDFKRYVVGENRNVFKKIITWDEEEIENELKEYKDRNKMLNNNVL